MLQSASRLYASESSEGEPVLGDLGMPELSPAAERVFAAIARVEALIEGYEPSAPVDHGLQTEIARLNEENAELKADRQELVQAVRMLKNQNQSLSLQMDEISTRMDAALAKISELLEE